MGAVLVAANADAHQEAAALAELLSSAAAANAGALTRLALLSTPQRRLLEGEILTLLARLQGGDAPASVAGAVDCCAASSTAGREAQRGSSGRGGEGSASGGGRPEAGQAGLLRVPSREGIVAGYVSAIARVRWRGARPSREGRCAAASSAPGTQRPDHAAQTAGCPHPRLSVCLLVSTTPR